MDLRNLWHHWLLLIASICFSILLIYPELASASDRVIIVKKSNQMLYYFNGQNLVLSMRVILGKPNHETPNIDTYLTHVVTNPTWTVPRSILLKELLPEIRKNGWFGDGWEILKNGIPVNPTQIDFRSNYFPYTLRQRPGKYNALGRVKFVLKNTGSIYMHDTLHKSLFGHKNRFFSHGCIRLEKPIQLANALGVTVPNTVIEQWHKITPIRVIIK